MHDLLTLYDLELRIDIDYPDMRKECFPRLVRFIRPVSGMNFIAYSRLDDSELDATIEAQIAYFAPMNQPFSWHVYAHDQPPHLKDRLLAHGFAPDDDPDAVMVLDLHEAAPALLTSVTADVRRLTGADQLDDVVDVLQQVAAIAQAGQRVGQRSHDHPRLPQPLRGLRRRPTGMQWLDPLPCPQPICQSVWRLNRCRVPPARSVHRGAGGTHARSHRPWLSVPHHGCQPDEPAHPGAERFPGADVRLCL